MLPVVAIIKAKPGKERELEKMLRGLVSQTRVEPGCGGYELHREIGDRGCFVFIESWLSEKDLQSHLESPHIRTAMGRKEELIESLEIKSLEPVGE